MVQSVSYLHIKPMEAYKGNGQGETKLVAFDSVLAENTASKATSGEEAQVNDKSADTAKTSTDDNATVLYKDPVSGKAVEYVDVAKQVSESDSTNHINSTTSAASMKKTKYDAIFKKAAKRYGVSESLLKGIAKAESNFNAKSVSGAGAMGVMQLMPVTAKSLGVKDPYDPEQNIMGGAKCIKQK